MQKLKNQYSFYTPLLLEEPFTIRDSQMVFQVKNVLRLKKGNQLLLSNGKGKKLIVEILDIQKNSLFVEPKETLESDLPSKNLHLVLGSLKKDTLKKILRQATEIGVKSIHVVDMDYSQVKTSYLKEKSDWLSSILKEAFEQSMHFFLPTYHFYKNWNSFWEEADKGVFLVSSLREKSLSVQDLFAKKIDAENYYVFVGPEGGFSQQEDDMFDEQQSLFFSLGEGILRTDTACALALGIVRGVC